MSSASGSPFVDQPAIDPDSGRVQVIVDTPRGSRNKYKFDPEKHLFKLSRVLPQGMVFPFDFGAIPGTQAEDGDALDVLILSEAPFFVGCLVQVRLIGVIHATQTEKRKTIRNDRLVGAVETSVNKAELRSLREMGDERLRQIEHFFRSYNQQQGREFRITGRGGAADAMRMLKRAIRQFEDQKQ